MLAEEAKACFSPWSTCWLHSSLEFEKSQDEIIPDPLDIGFVEPLPFTTEALNQIDIEIRSVFPESQLITPDVVRGDYETLNAAVLAREWPLLSEVTGKIMFAFDNAGSKRDAYISGHPSLTRRVMFTDSEPGSPEAALLKFNDPESSFDQIQNFVAQGYMVRTRADSDTVEARTNNTTRSEEALRSGAHFISTDYPVPDLRFSDYKVSIPGGYITRCNPVSAPNNCEDSEW
ncbi:Ca2+-dependent phosphoinositide-specific phospholipase C [Endozoicomonas atrinae]|uniref:Ca2+-dependent phosphoinositide-specific phospholipase C n=1 Tax=Endozoicomonas atrinae TaxID=1333660 RepID=UPI003B0084C8